MSYTSTTIILADGREVIVRETSEGVDADRLYEFLSGLPASLRNHMRYDVTKRELFDHRMRQLGSTSHWRLIAEIGGEIAAEATMDREPFGWTRHVADLRAVVSPDFAGLGLRSLLLHELVHIARRTGIGRVFTEMLAEQRELIGTLESVGFEREAVLRKFARDLKGQLHDIVIMTSDLESVWEQLQELVNETDIRIERSLSAR
jgi:GNAT superfamily N-acetyltransferase